MLKKFERILLVASIALIFVSVIFDYVSPDLISSDVILEIVAEISSLIFISIIGYGFSLSEKKSLKNTSNLIFSFYAIAMLVLVINMGDLGKGMEKSPYSLGYYLLIVSLVFIIMYLVLTLFNYLSSLDKNDNRESTAVKLGKWKSLSEQGVISSDEYNVIKSSIIDSKPIKKDLYSKLSELKDLKEKDLIEEEEFKSLKDNIINGIKK